MTQPDAAARAKIAAVQALMLAEDIDALDLDKDPTFKKLAAGVMAWNTLMMSSNIVRRSAKAIDTLASASVMLGVLFSYAYALGIRRGEMGKALKRRKRK